MALPKMFKKGSTKTKKTSSSSSNKNKMANMTSTKPKKKTSFLSLPPKVRQMILYPEFRAYIPLEITYRRRGQTPAYIDGLTGVYKRAIPECGQDVDDAAQKAKDAVEELVGDPDYYC